MEQDLHDSRTTKSKEMDSQSNSSNGNPRKIPIKDYQNTIGRSSTDKASNYVTGERAPSSINHQFSIRRKGDTEPGAKI